VPLFAPVGAVLPVATSLALRVTPYLAYGGEQKESPAVVEQLAGAALVTTPPAPPCAIATPPEQLVTLVDSQVQPVAQSATDLHRTCRGTQDFVSSVTVVHSGGGLIDESGAPVEPPVMIGGAGTEEAPPAATFVAVPVATGPVPPGATIGSMATPVAPPEELLTTVPVPVVPGAEEPEEPLQDPIVSATQSNPSPQSVAVLQGNDHLGTQLEEEQTIPVAHCASAVQSLSGWHSKTTGATRQTQVVVLLGGQAQSDVVAPEARQEKPVSQSALVLQVVAAAACWLIAMKVVKARAVAIRLEWNMGDLLGG